MADKYCIVYSLVSIESWNVVLPKAFICTIDKINRPAYIQANANLETYKDYPLIDAHDLHSMPLSYCKELEIAVIETSFLKKKSTSKHKIEDLLAEKAYRKHILNYIDRRMLQLYELILTNKLFLCWQLERKIKASDHLIHLNNLTFHPHARIIKTQTGCKYELTLKINDETLQLSTQKPKIITYFPATIILNNNWVNIAHIDSDKLRPFLSKDYIFIPRKITKQYFDTFVLDMIKVVEPEVIGFEFAVVSEILYPRLFSYYDHFERKWIIQLLFQYKDMIFAYDEQGFQKTKLFFANEEDIEVICYKRNTDLESYYCQMLIEEGLSMTVNKKFTPPNATEYSSLEWIINNKSIEHKSFKINQIYFEGKEVLIEKLEIIEGFKLLNDWFDLKGHVKIGSFCYPISILFSAIKKEEHFLRIENNKCAYIPTYILDKYTKVVKFARNNGDDWTLPKSNHMLLDKKESQEPFFNNPSAESTTRYTPSPNLNATLRDYQIKGVEWLIEHQMSGLGACLADDMGLGKTLQTIAAVLYAKENKVDPQSPMEHENIQLELFSKNIHSQRGNFSALIILPASLVFNWYEELKKYVPSFFVLKYIGNKRKETRRLMRQYDIVLTTYQTVIQDIDVLKELTFDYIVLDESQQIKNHKSKIFQTVTQLKTSNKLTLSGTPIENSLSDLWSQMEFINPSILGSYSFFKKSFQIPIEKNANPDAIQELKSIVHPFILRRTKSEVAKELPALNKTIAHCELTDEQYVMYEKEKSVARNHLLGLVSSDSKFKFHVLASLMKLRQIANHPILFDTAYTASSGKFQQAIYDISEILRAGHKILIFTSFTQYLKLFENWFLAQDVGFSIISGDTDIMKREEEVKKFQLDDATKVMLLSIKAGGVGLNLTSADYILILDPWWNPFVEQQAIARAHRIGRTNPVFVNRYISIGTIEQKILKLQEQKKEWSDSIIVENVIEKLSNEELLDLFEG